MSTYLSVRKWVDSLVGGPSIAARGALLPAIVPFLGVPLIGSWWMTIAIGWALLWTGFVAWRGYRQLRLFGIKGDREYDRKGKYRLAHEYRTTESATAARKRKAK